MQQQLHSGMRQFNRLRADIEKEEQRLMSLEKTKEQECDEKIAKMAIQVTEMHASLAALHNLKEETTKAASAAQQIITAVERWKSSQMVVSILWSTTLYCKSDWPRIPIRTSKRSRGHYYQDDPYSISTTLHPVWSSDYLMQRLYPLHDSKR